MFAQTHSCFPPPPAPSAPLDLTAYRWNSNTLWLRWTPPAHPGGALRNYTVRVDEESEKLVAADSRCVAWPKQVCAAVRVPGLRDGVHQVTVSATNVLVEQHGDEAKIAVSTKPGGE